MDFSLFAFSLITLKILMVCTCNLDCPQRMNSRLGKLYIMCTKIRWSLFTLENRVIFKIFKLFCINYANYIHRIMIFPIIPSFLTHPKYNLPNYESRRVGTIFIYQLQRIIFGPNLINEICKSYVNQSIVQKL